MVPVFPDFKADDLKGILDHSDSVLLFADDKVMEMLDCSELNKLYGVLKIEDYSTHCNTR